MNVTSKTKYALMGMVYMAEKETEKLSLKQISTNLNISKLYLESIFSLLRKHNLVVSIRGREGGYAFAKSPKDITVFDVFNIFEKELDQSSDVKKQGIEKIISEQVLMRTGKAIEEELRKITIFDLSEHLKAETSDKEPMYYL